MRLIGELRLCRANESEVVFLILSYMRGYCSTKLEEVLLRTSAYIILWSD